MTVTAAEARVEYAGNGVTTVFPYPYLFFENQDLDVWLRNPDGSGYPQILGYHYTLTGAMNPSGGTVTFTGVAGEPGGVGGPPQTGYTIIIINDPAMTQAAHYVNADDFPANSHERALDRLTKICQRLSDKFDRTLHAQDFIPISEIPTAFELAHMLEETQDAAEGAIQAERDAQLAAEAAAGSATEADTSAAEAAASAAAAGISASEAQASAESILGDVDAAAASAAAAAASATAAAASATAADVAKIEWKGAWASGTAYVLHDAVQYLGSSWVAKTSNTNKAPNTNPADWDLMAQKGDIGPQGVQGPVGPGTGDMLGTNNLSDVSNIATARNNIGALAKGGDTMTGLLILSADPGAPLGAATKQYVDANAVKYTAQSLTAAQQLQARTNIYAAPFDAMAYNGLQVNGSMEVSQQFGTAGTVVSGAYPVDGWKFGFVAAGAVIGAVQGASATKFPGFPNYLYGNVATAKSSLAAGDYAILYAPIEGYRIAKLAWGSANAQPITIGFWTAHHRTGLYSIAVTNNASNRTYVTTYTQAAADVAQYNTVTIPGDTTGTWETTNLVGMYVYFAHACGTTYTTATTNAWQAGLFFAGSGQVNGIAATSDLTVITGVVILPGNEAPTAARSPFIMRPFGNEIQTCQRYYAKSYHYTTPPGTNVGNAAGRIMFGGGAPAPYLAGSVMWPVIMRGNPTFAIFNNAGGGGTASYFTTVWNQGAGITASTGATDAGVGMFFAAGGTVTLINFDYVADLRL